MATPSENICEGCNTYYTAKCSCMFKLTKKLTLGVKMALLSQTWTYLFQVPSKTLCPRVS